MHITYPLIPDSKTSTTFHDAAPNIRHLRIAIQYQNHQSCATTPATTPAPTAFSNHPSITQSSHPPLVTTPSQNPTTKATTFPALPSLTALTIICPSRSPPSSLADSNIFTNLLTLRQALQSAAPPNLTRLAVENLNVDGILALRWGPFTSFGTEDEGNEDGESKGDSGRTWRGIEELDLSVLWEDESEDEDLDSVAGIEESVGEDVDEKPITGLKVLRDYVLSFAPTLTTLKLSYVFFPPAVETTAATTDSSIWSVLGPRPSEPKPILR